MRLAARLATAAAGGALLALAFPPHALLDGWIAVPAVTAHLVAWRGSSARVGALLGLVASVTCSLILLDWVRVLGPDAWVALSVATSALWVPGGALMPRALSGRWPMVAAPALWVSVEAGQARFPWGGFPWGRLAFTQADTVLGNWAVIGGPALVSAVVAAAGVAVLAGVDAARAVDRRGLIGAGGLVAGVVLGAGLVGAVDWGGPDGRVVPLAIVQGNVPRLGLDFNSQRRAVLDNHVRQTEALAADVTAGRVQAPLAVIWPENSSDVDPTRNADAAEAIDRAADAIGVPILVGAILANPADDGRTVLNASIVWDPVTGPGQHYVKQHPVPFGEYLPLRSVLSRFISRFDRIPRDFAPGDSVGMLEVAGIPTGVAICFEVAYDTLVADAIRAGGQLLVVQTNNATYGLTGQPDQQLAITRLQAIATGRTTLVAATSGISAVIEPDGRPTWTSTEFTADRMVADVALRTGLTPAMRVGALPELVAVGLLVALLLADRRARPRAPAGAISPDPGGPHGTMER